jgi:hypothetical protein
LISSFSSADVCRRLSTEPSHGENRGSSPLGSANDFNDLANKATTAVQFLSGFKHQGWARFGGYGGCGMALETALCQPSQEWTADGLPLLDSGPHWARRHDCLAFAYRLSS